MSLGSVVPLLTFKQKIDPSKAVEDGWNVNEPAVSVMIPEAKRITGQAIRATKAGVICLQEVENLDTLSEAALCDSHRRKRQPQPWRLTG